MKELLMATLSGAIVGLVFGFMKLPIPAPASLTGIMGIVGIFLGYIVSQNLR
ncbi:MAG: XapX domain-containing protein [Bacillota bacterium]|uniref:XapX domain-containing protein n=2 Tax=Carboxydocella TaxID=178898 RepID=A0A1T4PJX3_9FIRM|nr:MULTISPECIES: XapX domain-containing protein [Carboxydocella]AVX19509.1 XapX domain-containing protein [Carboxydocella thermautotrophica]AVX29927.1 XapX domain-containing protein [Carboxydocella thermautotrophica]GAW29012.1 XapX domain-containing protein [Carboxydocella sp. ULO1]SJZ91792.1 XapX domain-containing protein [Carboxydocella sporoproducens DSM 16521]